MKMAIGVVIGLVFGFLTAAVFAAASKDISYEKGFNDGMTNAIELGQVLATYNDEIVVGYTNGDLATFKRIKDD